MPSPTDSECVRLPGINKLGLSEDSTTECDALLLDAHDITSGEATGVDPIGPSF